MSESENSVHSLAAKRYEWLSKKAQDEGRHGDARRFEAMAEEERLQIKP